MEFCNLAVNAINLDAAEVIHYILKEADPAKFSFAPFTLQVCMQARATKCFEIIFEHFCRNLPFELFGPQVCRSVYHGPNGVDEAFVKALMNVITKIEYWAPFKDLKTAETPCTLSSICACQQMSFISKIYDDDTLTTLGDASIPEVLMVYHMQLRAEYGDDYIEPFTQSAIEELDPYLLFPSQDKRRLYHIPSLLDYIDNTIYTCFTATPNCVDPVTRDPLTMTYINSCLQEGLRIKNIYTSFIV